MDNDAFFRRATLEICGDLNIENAMSSFIGAVAEEIPIDRMFLQIYESDLGAMRTIAIATKATGDTSDVLTPMPEKARELVEVNFYRFEEGVVGISTPDANPVAAEMLKFHKIEGSSILQMLLSVHNGRFCSVVLTVSGEDRYDQSHVKLLAMLRRPFTIALYNTLKHREVLSLRDRLHDENQLLRTELNRTPDEIVGADFGLSGVMEMVRQVAPTESPVLLTGETGVGKDVVANAIHNTSPRRNAAFVAVNCGAIPETLVDSELFGHEKGAFTGALSTKRGRFERANGGTIFLDEVGEMPPSAQIRLLRVLQNKTIERVGGTGQIDVDTRIIAATNRDLDEMISSGGFREDLWFRLNVFPIRVLPLRERTVDIPSFVQHFIEKKARELKLSETPRLAPGAIDDLMTYTWPGNVRELENVIERAIILCQDGQLRFDLTGPINRQSAAMVDASEVTMDGTFSELDDVVRDHIQKALLKTEGKIHGPSGAGELLGVNPNTLRHRMRKLGIPFAAQTKPSR